MFIRKATIGLAGGLLVLWSATAIAVQPLEIKSVVVDEPVGGPVTLIIYGENLTNGSDLELWLGGVMLDVHMDSLTSTQVYATLPVPIMDGSYQLIATTGGGTVRFDDFDGVTIGAVGPQGPQGEPGVAGLPGADGVDGAQGPKGDKGDTGDTGPPGADGLDGAPGEDGLPGADGADGANGLPGVPGDDGLDGANCYDNISGGTSVDDCIGPKGDKGDKGDTGPEGPQGLPGTGGGSGAVGQSCLFGEFLTGFDDDGYIICTFAGNLVGIDCPDKLEPNADLRNCVFDEEDSLRLPDFSLADLSGADLRGARFILEDVGHHSFVGADLSHSIFYFTVGGADGMDLGRTDFSGANLSHARLYDVRGTCPNFSNATLIGTQFGTRYIGLSNSYFEPEYVSGDYPNTICVPSFAGATIADSIWQDTSVDVGDFSNAIFENMIFRRGWMGDGNYSGAIFTDVVFDEIALNRSNFAGATFDNVTFNNVLCPDDLTNSDDNGGTCFGFGM